MPYNRGLKPQPGRKSVEVLNQEFQATVDAYNDALDAHAADVSEHHSHVNAKIMNAKITALSLQGLRDKIEAA